MKFNENLKYLRKEANLTQENLAERLNVSRQAVTKWESGQSLPDIENLKQMADLFGVTMDSLVGDVETKKESIINKKINDIGYFIFAQIILLGALFFSMQDFVKQITANETIIVVTSALVVFILFIVFVLLLKMYLKDTKSKIINMKPTEDGKKERKKYIIKKAKFEVLDFILYGLVSVIHVLPQGINVYLINIAKWSLGSIAFIALIEYFEYSKLEKKVKKLNENEK